MLSYLASWLWPRKRDSDPWSPRSQYVSFSSFEKSSLPLSRPRSSIPAFGSTSSLGVGPMVNWLKRTSETQAPILSDKRTESSEVEPANDIPCGSKFDSTNGENDVKCLGSEDLSASGFFKPKLETICVIEQEEGGIVDNFDFLHLPPELRLWVYRAALVPTGFYRLSRTREDDRSVATANYIPNLLRTCHQINDEIKDMIYSENTFYIDVDNIGPSACGVILRNALNNATWPLVQHVVLTLNLPNDQITLNYLCQYRRCDWRQLQRMTGLKTVRIMIIEPDLAKPQLFHRGVLKRVIRRLPASCLIEFGPKTDLDAQHAAEWVAVTTSQLDRNTYVADPKELEKVARSVSCQGQLSGTEIDARWTSKMGDV